MVDKLLSYFLTISSKKGVNVRFNEAPSRAFEISAWLNFVRRLFRQSRRGVIARFPSGETCHNDTYAARDLSSPISRDPTQIRPSISGIS